MYYNLLGIFILLGVKPVKHVVTRRYFYKIGVPIPINIYKKIFLRSPFKNLSVCIYIIDYGKKYFIQVINGCIKIL